MDQPDDLGPTMREVWKDHESRQRFEHDLINRKTTWLLTTQSILFAAYGVTFQAEDPDVPNPDLIVFRTVVAWSGFLVALIILGGVIGLIRSKDKSWRSYEAFFEKNGRAGLFGPLADRSLQWGVDTRNTWLTLAPDVLLPFVFMLAWVVLLASAPPAVTS